MTLAVATDTYHLLPGRLRIAVTGLRRSPLYAEYLEKRLRTVRGLEAVSANPLTGRALIHFSPALTSFRMIVQELARCRADFARLRAGISQAAAAAEAVTAQAQGNPSLSAKAPLLFAATTGGVLAAILAKRLLVGRSPLAASPRVLNLAALTALVSGYPILRDGLDQLTRKKHLNSDLLIFAATLVLLAMRESITGLSVLWLVHLSNLFRHAMQARTRAATHRLIAQEHSYALRVTENKVEKIPLSRLNTGDAILVPQDGIIPMDGEVLEGEATIAHPQTDDDRAVSRVHAGERVPAGARVQDGRLMLKVSGAGAKISILPFIRKADNVQKPLSPDSEALADKLVPWSVGVALLTALLTRDLSRGLAVLLAGCPVAVALSRHTALGSALGVAVRDGVYIQDSRSLEAAGQADTLLFDAPGTIAAAVPRTEEITVLDRAYTRLDMLELAASAVMFTEAPVAEALADRTRREGGRLRVARTQTVAKDGFRATVDDSEVLVGNENFMTREKIKLSRGSLRSRRMLQMGHSVLYVAVNGRLIGLMSFSEQLRPESAETITMLRAAGVKHIEAVAGGGRDLSSVTDHLGLNEHWTAAGPEDRLALVRRLQQAGRRVMLVGDGKGDGGAMAAANVGVTLGSSFTGDNAEVPDIVVRGKDLRKIPYLIHLSKRTREIIRQNLALSAGLSFAGVALAVGRMLSPVTAMLLLNVSTAAVLLNSARILRFRPVPHEPDFNLQRFQSPGAEIASAAPTALAFPILSPGDPEAAKQDFAADPADKACERLDTSSYFGLNEQEAVRRREKYGPNMLEKAERPGFWKLFLGQFKDFMVQVLLGAAGLSFALGRGKDALLTLAIVVANAVLGVVQEQKAEKSLDALQRMAAPHAQVIREGRTRKIASAELVPGDVIVLEAGDRVPADARLLNSWRLEAEEASLTGETIPAKKEAALLCGPGTGLGDRKNMVFMGTAITRGRATAVVVATGMSTEMGRIARLIEDYEENITPLQRRLEEVGKFIVYGCLGVSAVIFGVGLLRGIPGLYMLQTAASLAVAAIPEGLSAIVLVALAMGVQRMSKRNIIIRRLASIETLGCATVICSDKTGTLTKNEMTVRNIHTVGKTWRVSGEGYSPSGKIEALDASGAAEEDHALRQTLLAGLLCNNSRLIRHKSAAHDKVVSIDGHKAVGWRVEGDPTEGAMLVAAAKLGLWRQDLEKNYQWLWENPFESERRMMSVLCAHQDEHTLFCKGAPDKIIGVCTHYLDGHTVKSLDAVARRTLLQANTGMAAKALRVLALAYRPVSSERLQDEPDTLETDLIFTGLMGLIDPPRPEVPAAIGKCRQAGVKVVMITGDHPETAAAIAREIGLWRPGDRIVSGAELDNMSDEQLAAMVRNVSVYARTSPHHKLRIVKALKKEGFIVAMTGDGVNDAPAVKSADIGIAMGQTGTDVTKEAASITLSDDNFATIVQAMEEGRSIYANIRKAIRYLIATNIGEVVLMMLAVVAGLPLPLVPIQLLWLNLLGDGLPAVALVNDPPARNIMQHPPRSADHSVFAGGLGRKIISRGLSIGLVSLALFAWKLRSGAGLMYARTLVLVQIALSQFLHIFDCRLEKYSGRVGLFSNLWLVAAVALSMAMVVGIVHIPALHALFGTTALGPGDWLIAVLFAGATAAVDLGLCSVLKATFRPKKPLLKLAGC
ncbi:MAG TPA: HAD-IC family P-type ATPase [Selenomonadales bacterium]|nr:HAD-IC family P-type ATPase [Selenomonadales bacterium]